MITETLFGAEKRAISVVLTDVGKKFGERGDFLQLSTVTRRGRLLTGAQTNCVEAFATP